MRRHAIALVFALAFGLALGHSASAQEKKTLPRIGFLGTVSPSVIAARTDAFRQGLRDLGYREGENILIEYRWAEGNLDRVPERAAQLARLKVDVIVTTGPPATRVAKVTTASIPIVMAFDTDPVRNGFVASLARPGGNITGLSALFPELTGKRLELLKEIVPRLGQIVVLGQSTEPANAQTLRETELAAGALGVKLHYIDVVSSKDITSAIQDAARQRADAILVLAGYVFNSQPRQLADLAIKYRLPSVYQGSEYVKAGGLMSYGTNIAELFRRAATYVDKILKGAKPADLPVEQPKKFEFVVNLKTAKQIGLTIPPNVLARADKVIR